MGPDLRGKIINRAFLNMWGLPDDFIETRPTIADVINYNRHNNIYDVSESEFDAYIATRVEEVEKGDFPPYERHLADGRIIRYEGIVLPDGGRLLSYFDITELKRQELEAKRAEIAITEAHARINHILSSSPSVIYSFTVTENNNATFVSENIKDLLGYEPDEYLSDRKFWEKRLHPDDAPNIATGWMGQLLKEGHHINEYRFRHKDGSYRWLHDELRVIYDDANKPVEIVGSWSDVTAMKQQEQELAETYKQKSVLLNELTAILDTIDFGVMFMGPDLRGKIINRAFLNIWGLPDDFVESRPTIADVINYNRHNNIYDVSESEFDAYIASRTEEVEKGDFPPYERHLKDGRIIRYEGIVLPDGGRLLSYFDITELKQRELEAKKAEATITAAHARLNHTLASSPSVLYSFEAIGDNNPTFVSENIRDIFGYEPSDYLENRNFVKDHIHPDDAGRIEANLSCLFEEGYQINEYRFRHKDGSYRWVHDVLKIIQDNTGAPVEIVGTWSDISARKEVTEGIIDLLSSTSLFEALDESALRDMAADANSVQLMGGETLIRQGDSAESFYLVISGRVRAFVTEGNEIEHLVGEIGKGELVGEMSVLTGEPRPASARAIRDTVLLQFPKDTLYRLVENHPKVLLLISKVIADRYQTTSYGTGKGSVISTIAIIPAGHDVQISDFTRNLAKSLSHFGSTLHLDVKSIEQGLSQESTQKPNNDSISEWLNDQESRHQYVIYESTLEPSSWTQQCIRHADRILLVGVNGNSHELNLIEKEIVSQQNTQILARQELVLLHPNRDKLPSGTGKWLSLRNLADHHHIIFDSIDDYKRLCRFITGNAISLVLGGGGARGCAHIGLIRALRELDIPIDAIGGTSIGSIVASAFALGCNSDEMLDKIDDIARESKPIKDLTFPIVSLMTGRKLNKGLQKMYGDVYIEDLWVKYYSVSANLTRAQTEVNKRGPVWKSVRRSMSIPGQIPPIVFNGELHVDGGVLDNLPVDVMREMCSGIIIANNVSPRVDLNMAGSNEATHSGWYYMLNTLNPFSKYVGLPNIFVTLMRSGMLSSIKAANVSKAMADIYMSPPIDEFQLLDFESSHEIEEVGYKYTLEVMKQQLHDNELLNSVLI